jgi:hypothetical protein
MFAVVFSFSAFFFFILLLVIFANLLQNVTRSDELESTEEDHCKMARLWLLVLGVYRDRYMEVRVCCAIS